MADATDPFAAALERLEALDREAYGIKLWINQGCAFSGREPMFPDLSEPGKSPQGRGLRIGPDDFFNKPFATAVRDILAMREAAGMTRAASIDEIHAALREGGFNFPFTDVEKQKHGLATSLGKNTVTFRKLPSGLFGLAEWYGGAKAPKKARMSVVDSILTEAAEPEDDGTADDDEAAGSPPSETPAASDPTPNSADEDGREVEHDIMSD